MEKSIDLFGVMKQLDCLEDVDMKTYSPLTLAYIGDAVYEMVIRTKLVVKGNSQVNKLHKRASELVNAHAQAVMIESLCKGNILSEAEMNIYKRGRNAKAVTKAKNASMIDYRTATVFEALVGYLYLSEQSERMMILIETGIANYYSIKEQKKQQ